MLKSKTQWRLCRFTLKNWINFQLPPTGITNFLAFLQFLFEKIFLLDPDPGGKNECGSTRIRIHSPDRDLNTVYIINKFSLSIFHDNLAWCCRSCRCRWAAFALWPAPACPVPASLPPSSRPHSIWQQRGRICAMPQQAAACAVQQRAGGMAVIATPRRQLSSKSASDRSSPRPFSQQILSVFTHWIYCNSPTKTSKITRVFFTTRLSRS